LRRSAIAAEFCAGDLGGAAPAAACRLQGTAALLAKTRTGDIACIAVRAIALAWRCRAPVILLDAATMPVLAALPIWRIVSAAMVAKAKQVFEKTHFVLLLRLYGSI
jgi:hypothetical protein